MILNAFLFSRIEEKKTISEEYAKLRLKFLKKESQCVCKLSQVLEFQLQIFLFPVLFNNTSNHN